MAGDRAPKIDAIPWEFRINTFPPIGISSRTLPKRYNFWEQTEGNEIHVGFHSQKESVAGERFATLLPLDKEGKRVALQVERGVDEKVKAVLLPVIVEGLKEKGIIVDQVLEVQAGSKDTKEMD